MGGSEPSSWNSADNDIRCDFAFFSYYSELECVFEVQPLFKMADETSGNHGVSRVMNSM